MLDMLTRIRRTYGLLLVGRTVWMLPPVWGRLGKQSGRRQQGRARSAMCDAISIEERYARLAGFAQARSAPALRRPPTAGRAQGKKGRLAGSSQRLG